MAAMVLFARGKNSYPLVSELQHGRYDVMWKTLIAFRIQMKMQTKLWFYKNNTFNISMLMAGVNKLNLKHSIFFFPFKSYIHALVKMLHIFKRTQWSTEFMKHFLIFHWKIFSFEKQGINIKFYYSVDSRPHGDFMCTMLSTGAHVPCGSLWVR